MDFSTATTKLWLKTPQCTQSKSNITTVYGGEFECLQHYMRSQMAEFLYFLALVMVKIHLAATGSKQIELLAKEKLREFTPSIPSIHSSKVKRLICCTCPTWYDWLKTLTFLTWPAQCNATHRKSKFFALLTHLQGARQQSSLSLNKNKPPLSANKLNQKCIRMKEEEPFGLGEEEDTEDISQLLKTVIDRKTVLPWSGAKRTKLHVNRF